MQAGRKKNLVWIVTVVAVMLVAGGLGFGLRYWQSRNDTGKTSLPTERPLQKNVSAAQNYALDGRYELAYKEIDDGLKNPKLSTEDRFRLLYQKGLTYFNQQKYAEAVAAYQEAAKVKETKTLYETLGDAADLAGDKATAIAAYKKAIQLISSTNNPLAEDDRVSYEEKIKALGGQP